MNIIPQDAAFWKVKTAPQDFLKIWDSRAIEYRRYRFGECTGFQLRAGRQRILGRKAWPPFAPQSPHSRHIAHIVNACERTCEHLAVAMFGRK